MQQETEVIIGGTYKVVDSRKGTFYIKVTTVRGEWVDGVITNGVAGAIMRYNVKSVGEEISIRKSLALFYKVDL